MTNHCIVYTMHDMQSVVVTLQKLMQQCHIFAFSGPLGAGKTTLIRMLAASRGVTEVVTSPTFSYVNIYHTPGGSTIYHFDLYRIKTVEDFIQAGFGEYLEAPNSWVFIEWPEVVMPLLTHSVCFVSIDYHSEHERQLCYRVQR